MNIEENQWKCILSWTSFILFSLLSSGADMNLDVIAFQLCFIKLCGHKEPMFQFKKHCLCMMKPCGGLSSLHGSPAFTRPLMSHSEIESWGSLSGSQGWAEVQSLLSTQKETSIPRFEVSRLRCHYPPKHWVFDTKNKVIAKLAYSLWPWLSAKLAYSLCGHEAWGFSLIV